MKIDVGCQFKIVNKQQDMWGLEFRREVEAGKGELSHGQEVVGTTRPVGGQPRADIAIY